MITFIGYRNEGASIDKDDNLSTSRVFTYHFNASETPLDILGQPEIPDIGAEHPSNDKCFVIGKACSSPQEGDGLKSGRYDVTVSYSMPTSGEAKKTDRTKAPWKMAPYDISIAPREYVVPFIKGYKDGDQMGAPTVPVVNSAGDPYEDSMTKQNAILKFSYNLQKFDDTWQEKFIDTINGAPIRVCNVPFQKFKARLAALVASRQYVYDSTGLLKYEYWRVDVEIERSGEEWKREILCRGLFAKDANGKYRIHVRKDDAPGPIFGRAEDLGKDPVPCDEPQLLDATTGYLLSSTGDGTAQYQTFRDKFAVSWAPLSFPERTR